MGEPFELFDPKVIKHPCPINLTKEIFCRDCAFRQGDKCIYKKMEGGVQVED